MTLARLPVPIPFPALFDNASLNGFLYYAAGNTIDAATEKAAHMGTLILQGGATGKAFSTGTGKIHWQTGSVTWSAAATVRIGLQGLATASGPPFQPDGSFTIYKDLVQGTDSLAGSTAQVTTMASGSNQTLGTGDRLAVVFDMTDRTGGTASVIVQSSQTLAKKLGSGAVAWYASSAWQVTSTSAPCVVLETDDGTLGFLMSDAPPVASAGNNYQFNDSSSYDEYGLQFQVPFRCKVIGVKCHMAYMNAAARDFVWSLYSDPTGTPASLASVTGYGEQSQNNTDINVGLFLFSSEVELSPNTNYCVACKATTSTDIFLPPKGLMSANHRPIINGGSSLAVLKRNNSSGAFTSESTTSLINASVLISQLDDGSGMGASSMNIGGLH